MDVNKTSTLIAVCERLLKMKLGDKSRLQTIKARAEQGRVLYALDKKYVEKMAAYIKYEDIPQESPPRRPEPVVEEQVVPEPIVEEVVPPRPEPKQQSSFCGNCGKDIPPSNNFCTNCGAKKVSVQPQQAPSQPSSTKYPKEWSRTSKKQSLEEYEKEYLSRVNAEESVPSSPPREPPRQEIPRQRESSQDYDRERYERSRQRPADWKSEGITLLCSILGGLVGLQGIGYIYLGKIGKGIGYLVGSIILFVVAIVLIATGIGAVAGGPMLIAYFVMFIWQIIDSYKLCKKYNDYYEEFGRAPQW